MSEMSDFNTKVIEDFRANDGKVGGQFAGAPMVLITTTGAKSGQRRTTPLVYLREGDRVFIFGSKAGADTNPAWYHNLTANPELTVELPGDTYEATAEELKGAERDRVFASQVAVMPGFQTYADSTSRVIPVIELKRAN